jgi:hypothetical protein
VYVVACPAPKKKKKSVIFKMKNQAGNNLSAVKQEKNKWIFLGGVEMS